MEEKTQTTTEEIDISEMKMPEEPFGSNVPEQKKSLLGPIVGILIIVLLLILVGLYLWGNMLSREPVVGYDAPQIINDEPETNNTDADIQALKTQSSSDEIDTIEADIESTNLENLDKELNAIEAEFDSALGTN